MGFFDGKTPEPIEILVEKYFLKKYGEWPGEDLNERSDRFEGGCPEIEDVELVVCDYAHPPEGWSANPVLAETDFIKAFENYREYEVLAPESKVKIVSKSYSPTNNTGLPIARIDPTAKDCTVTFHPDFIEAWNYIRQNDIWYRGKTYNSNERLMKDRIISVAWGVFYRLAKRILTDLEKSRKRYKGLGYITYMPDIKSIDVEYKIFNPGSHYAKHNESIWLWFLGSYAFFDTTRFNNDIFEEQIRGFFSYQGRAEKLHEEFYYTYKLLNNPPRLTEIFNIAKFINYNFFSRKWIEVPPVLKRYQT